MELFLCYKKPRVCQQLLITSLFLHVFCIMSTTSRNEQDMSVQQGKAGLCSFGRLQSCCYGWRNVNGDCQPVCKKPCVNGRCVAPDRCSCHQGYKGKQCNDDINECGLHHRPCSHSCMNTQGSFRCFCDPGYTLDPDGRSCTKEPDCSDLRCQLGCQIGRNGAQGCLCPPGLQLALDNRTCKDIDECEGPFPNCSERQACKNTFGSYMCVCRSGYVLGTLGNSITCRDEDECVTGQHSCSRHAHCMNTMGSFTCRCEDDYTGDGFNCWKKKKKGRSQAPMYFQYKLSKHNRFSKTKP